MSQSNGNGQSPPVAVDAERAVIGSLLLSRDAEAVRRTLASLSPDDIWSSYHRIIYRTIGEMHRAGGVVDAVTLCERLGADYVSHLSQCMETVQHASHMDYYAAIVRDRAERRRIIAQAQQMIADAWDISRPIDGLGGPDIKFYSGPELAELDTTIQWLVDGVLVAAQSCLNAAPKKTLKTNSLIDLVLSLATGTPFLGKFHVPEAVRAGIMSAESGSGTIKETANRIAVSKGFHRGVRDCPDAFFAFETPMITTPDECQKFERYIDEKGLRLFVIDPTYLTFIIGDDGKNIFRMGQLLSPLNKIIQRTGCTIILSHHSKKGAGKDGEPLDLGDESYSGFSEWARQWLYLSRREPYDETRPGSHRLWLRYGGSVGHSGLHGLDIEEGSFKDPYGRKWDVRAVDAKAIREERQDATATKREQIKESTFRRHMDKIRAALKVFPEGGTLNDIAGKARISKDNAKSCIFELLALNEVKECDVAKGKRTFDGFCLTGTSGTVFSPTGTVPLVNEWDSGTNL